MRCQPNGNTRFLRKNTNENERRTISMWMKEMINLYGTYVDYAVYGYQLSAHDFFYGEHPTAAFYQPSGMVILCEMQNDTLLLSKFGIQTDADLTCLIHIDDFRNTFGYTAEPKAGDLIILSELGWDRPGAADPYPGTFSTGATGYTQTLAHCPSVLDTTRNSFISGYANERWVRGAPIFEITERRDDNIPLGINPLMGHYVWVIKCKRFDYSYQPGINPEPGSQQVSDETLYGRLSGYTNPASPAKQYDQNINDDARQEWDYNSPSEGQGNSSVYGDY